MKKNIYQYNIDWDEDISEDVKEIVKKSQKELNKKFFAEELYEHRYQNEALEFIQKKKRILYGGFALHMYVKHFSKKKDFIYEEQDICDVEFYSPTPAEDLQELSERIIKKHHNFEVQIKEAIHPMTYTLFVNFNAICDASYMPPNIFQVAHYFTISDIRVIDHQFIFLDKLRMFSDPLLSYRRIEKELARIQKMAKYISLHDPHPPAMHSPKNNSLQSKINNMLMTYIKPVNVGNLSLNFFQQQAEQKVAVCYDVEIYISQQYQEMDRFITNYLIGGEVPFRKFEFNKFFQFTDFWTLFVIGDFYLCLMKNNKICIPYQVTPGKNIIGSFDLCMLYAFIMEQFGLLMSQQFSPPLSSYAHNLELWGRAQKQNLYNLRQKFISQNQTNFISPSYFQSFQVQCLGESAQPIKDKLIRAKVNQYLRNYYNMNLNQPQKNQIPMPYYDIEQNGLLRNKKSYLEPRD